MQGLILLLARVFSVSHTVHQLPHLQSRHEWEGKKGRKGGKQGGLGDFSLSQCFRGYKLKCNEFIVMIITKSDLNALFKMTSFAPISIESAG